jgi:flagellar biosynthetic protein FliR
VPITLDEASLVALLLAAARIMAWAVVAPPLATGGVPHPVKVVVSVALGLVMVPLVRTELPPLETVSIVGAVLEQVLIGAGLGFATRMLFAAVEAAGSLLDLFGGFSVATAYDPMSGAASSIFGRFYGLLCTVLIFATDAHLVIFQGFLRTFRTLPADGHLSLSRLDSQLASGFTGLFVAALQIAGPLLVVLFVADLALGVLNRISPQLNAFSLSFPLKIGLTLLLVGLGFTLMPRLVVELAGQSTRVIGAVTGT